MINNTLSDNVGNALNASDAADITDGAAPETAKTLSDIPKETVTEAIDCIGFIFSTLKLR